MSKNERMNKWQLAETAIKYLRVVGIVGPPSVGKTHLCQHGDFIPVSCSDDDCKQELFGHIHPNGQTFIWKDGPCVTAFREGKTLVINEVQRASGAVKDAMLSLLDSRDSAVITLSDGEQVRAHKNFKALLTSNESLEEMEPAFYARCESVVTVTEPHPGLVDALNQLWPLLGTVVLESFSDPTRAICPRSSFAYAKLRNADVPREIAAELAYKERWADVTDVFAMRGVQ